MQKRGFFVSVTPHIPRPTPRPLRTSPQGPRVLRSSVQGSPDGARHPDGTPDRGEGGGASCPAVAVAAGADDATRAVVSELLSQRGYDVHVYDRCPLKAFNVLPLVQFAMSVGANLVVPTDRANHLGVSSGRALFDRAGIAVLSGNVGATSLASDRLYTHAHLWSRGVAVPEPVCPVNDTALTREWCSSLAEVGGKAMAVPRSITDPRRAWTVETDFSPEASFYEEAMLLRPDDGPLYWAPVFRSRDGRSGQTAAVVAVPTSHDPTLTGSAVPTSHDPALTGGGGADEGSGTVAHRELADQAAGPTHEAAELPSDAVVFPYPIPGMGQRVELPHAERLALAAARAIGMTGPCGVWIQDRAEEGLVVCDIVPGYDARIALTPEVFDAGLVGARRDLLRRRA